MTLAQTPLHITPLPGTYLLGGHVLCFGEKKQTIAQRCHLLLCRVELSLSGRRRIGKIVAELEQVLSVLDRTRRVNQRGGSVHTALGVKINPSSDSRAKTDEIFGDVVVTDHCSRAPTRRSQLGQPDGHLIVSFRLRRCGTKLAFDGAFEAVQGVQFLKLRHHHVVTRQNNTPKSCVVHRGDERGGRL